MTNPSSTAEQRRGHRLVARTVLTSATAAAFIGLATVSASAAPADVATDSVVANVNVSSTITLDVDQGSFNLNGTPLSTVSGLGAVTGLVKTNNAAGYSVGVQAAATALQPSTSTNPDSIPIANLQVANNAGAYTPLSAVDPVITHTKPTRSALAGDAFVDDYRVDIPDVNSGTYSVTLNYTATALA